ncbi:MAG: hypothetical protein ACRDTV_09955, partial [Mycobacterium sp.]
VYPLRTAAFKVVATERGAGQYRRQLAPDGLNVARAQRIPENGVTLAPDLLKRRTHRGRHN